MRRRDPRADASAHLEMVTSRPTVKNRLAPLEPSSMPSSRRLPKFLRGFAFALLALLPFGAWSAGDTTDIAVRVRKDGPVIYVEVDCPVAAQRSTVWEVLTYYDNMPRFISNLEQSVVRLRGANRLIVYQKGKASRGPLNVSVRKRARNRTGPRTGDSIAHDQRRCDAGRIHYPDRRARRQVPHRSHRQIHAEDLDPAYGRSQC